MSKRRGIINLINFFILEIVQISVSELAENLGISSSSLSGTLNRIRKKLATYYFDYLKIFKLSKLQ
ncbi:MAG: hypothetical protein EU529_08410 [Promethearchaeota archaeon]|nr:MAG: hypothetical protein EU529_08410 [Candidatus Lokiarchaeota archaeon]